MLLRRSLRVIVLVFLSAIVCAAALAEETISYLVSLEDRHHHEAHIELRLEDLTEPAIEFRMSRTSPGRYALHEFAKNVYDVSAVDGAGRSLSIERPNLHQWNVSGHDSTVVLRYTVFGDRSDGTYIAVDDTHAHFNAPASFMWARGLGERPIRVRFTDKPAAWSVATQLRSDDGVDFWAPNLAYFLDSPIEVSDFTLLEWPVSSDGAEYTIRLAVHHQGSEEQALAFRKLAEAVVLEQIAVYGELPKFDFGSYTFIADYLPWVNGDGMEHRNSTVLSSTRTLSEPLSVIGTLSHEFFHAWNVERIRPTSLEPFDFEKANVSEELWFAEGFTSYYDDLTLRRARIFSLDRFASALTGSLDTIVNAPGRRLFSPMEMSQRAPFVDAATSVDPQNRSNIFASYYPYGAVLALGLDLEIRTRYPGKSLDDLMRLMWDRHGKTEVTYDVSDIERALADTVDDASFAKDFFDRSIRKSELPDFETLLANAGLLLRRRYPGTVWLGAQFRGGTLQLDGVSVFDSPAYQAGLDRGDVILSLDGVGMSRPEDFTVEMAKYEPGQQVTITYEERSGVKNATLLWQENPTLEVVPFEAAGREVSPTIAEFRTHWLGPKAVFEMGMLAECEVCGRHFPTEESFCRYDGTPLVLRSPRP